MDNAPCGRQERERDAQTVKKTKSQTCVAVDNESDRRDRRAETDGG